MTAHRRVSTDEAARMGELADLESGPIRNEADR